MNMEAKIKIAVHTAIENGTRKLRITYKQESVQGLYVLMALVNKGVLAMSDDNLSAVLSAKFNGEWGHDNNRSFTVELTKKFNDDSLIAPMAFFAPHIEKIAYAKPKQPA
jgi:hypothetical protein